MVQKQKKCTPLKCKTFSKKANRLELVMPIDELVLDCQSRESCFCTNEKETFKGATY